MSDWKETAEYKLLKYTRSIKGDDVFVPVKENIYDHLRRRLLSTNDISFFTMRKR